MVLGITTRSGRARPRPEPVRGRRPAQDREPRRHRAGRRARRHPALRPLRAAPAASTWRSRSWRRTGRCGWGSARSRSTCSSCWSRTSLLRHRVGPRVFRARALDGLRDVAAGLRARPRHRHRRGHLWMRGRRGGLRARRRPPPSAGAPPPRSPSAAARRIPRTLPDPEGGDPMTIARRASPPRPAPAGCSPRPVPGCASTSTRSARCASYVDLAGPRGARRPGRPRRRRVPVGPQAARRRRARPRGGRRQRRRGRAGQRQGPHAAARPRPHLVLDGLVLAARAVGARRPTSPPPGPRSPGTSASRSRCAASGCASRSCRSTDRFVAGEESALVNALNGRPGVPSDRLRAGLRARRATAARPWCTTSRRSRTSRCSPGSAPDWFRSVGTAEEPGTFLATVSGAVPSPGVFEVPFGTSLGGLLAAAGAVAARRAGRAGRRLPRGLGPGPRRRRAPG